MKKSRLMGAVCAWLPAVIASSANAAAVWLFASGLLGLIGVARKKTSR